MNDFRKWKERFPRLVSLLACQLGQDFSIWGTTMDVLTRDFIKHECRPQDVMFEINHMIALIKAGDIDPDRFMEEIKEYKIPKYKHLSMLEYFEAIRDSLEKNRQEIYGNDAERD